MNSELAEMIADHGLEDYQEFLLRMMRPCIDVVCHQKEAALGGSKLSGTPDLPPHFAWPVDADGPCRFLAQFRLDDLPRQVGALPPRGVLSFFCLPEKECPRWDEEGFIRAFYFADSAALQPAPPPALVQPKMSCAVELREGVSLPPWPWRGEALAAWPIEEDLSDAYEELRTLLCSWDGYLLGYPTYSSLAYDPTPAGGWSSLLTLRSNRKLEWSWHDGGWLMVFVEDKRRDAGDFSNLRVVAG